MLGIPEERPYAITGTTPPIYIPRDSGQVVQPGRTYFFVKVHSAQAAFTGAVWEKVKRLIVTSQVNLHHPSLGSEGLRAIQRSREVQKNRAEQLGLSPNLIKLVPAVMPQVGVSIEFILDKENQLAALGGLINDDSFLAAVSLAPGAAMVAKTVGGLAQKIITSFVPAQDREPILQFSGDFNLAASGLQEGYYAILGTRDEHNPLPSPLPKLEVRDGDLLGDSKRITQLSYVVLDVRCTKARTRDLNDGAAWDAKLREAEDEAQRGMGDPLATDDERRQAWDKCRNLLREAQSLLRADPNYLRDEAEAIVKASYQRCSKLASDEEKARSAKGPVVRSASAWRADAQADRAFLGIPVGEDLDATLDQYAEQVVEARRILGQAGLQ
jgi:hypothetical protein